MGACVPVHAPTCLALTPICRYGFLLTSHEGSACVPTTLSLLAGSLRVDLYL